MTLATTLMIIAVGFILTVLLTPLFIPALKRMKFGQSIREEGPKSHMKKAGTPTMGGLVFLLSIVLTTLGISLYFNMLTTQTIVLLLVLVGFGVIGFLDDFIKVVLKRNLGLTSLQKLIGQIILAIAAFFLLILFTTVVTTGTSFSRALQ
jgi:phospho-N-acetylmuramoyl-pentapeptide-transferase